MEMLNYPNLQLCRFVLTVDDEDGSLWFVFLDGPARLPYDPHQPSMLRTYSDIKFKGKSDSLEDAYKDLLEWTAEMLHRDYRDGKKIQRFLSRKRTLLGSTLSYWFSSADCFTSCVSKHPC
ncbi:unnamed protein product [Aureobasidium vineae]|uniref:Uncharacterized protein n=1 Tax=Aureobasidium vineae TaxID=2773715 RepID=A0A9N8J6X8_9PEZI|nr:unnamed protein product [Aureobasidium vineae]